MKKLLFIFILTILPMLASAQTVSDVQNSGCMRETRSSETQWVPTIVLTKEGSTLSVQLLNYVSDCCTKDFNVTSNINGGNNGGPCSIAISVVPVKGHCDCICPYNVSFTIRDLESNGFYLDCWWYKGQMELTEGEPLVLEDIYEDVTIDGINFTLRKAFHQAMLTKSEWVGEVRIPSELSYEGQTYSVTSMYNGAFMDNTTLTKVYFPRSIKSMDFREEGGLYWNPFYKCSALESIEVEDGNPMFSTVDGVLFNKEKTKIYCYPAADSRTSYTLPENITSLGDYAFSGCKLESLYIRGTIDFHRTDDYRSFGDMGTQTKVYVQPSQVDQFKALYKGPVYPLPEQTAYYYYNGNKIPLTLNENRVIVSVPKDCDGTSKRIRANVPVLSTIKDKVFDIFIIPRSDFEKLTSQDFWEEDAKSVVLTSSYYAEDNKEVFETPYLNVELKKEEDAKLLDSYAEKYRLRNLGSFSQYLPKWYVLYVTPESDKSPLQCANELYESGDFAASVPDFASDDYRPFVEEGKVWKVGSTTGISDGIVQMVDYYYFDGDTIIDGKTCKQMMCQRYVSPNHPDYAIIVQSPSLKYIGAWYEEDKKVYMYNEINQLRLMYDFSLDANETILIDNYPYVIGPEQTGGLKGFKGVYRDVMWRGDEESYYCTAWLEGVGGIDGPTVNIYSGEENHGLFLMSCIAGDEVIYLNDEYEDGATPEEARKKRFDFTHTIKIQPKARKRSEEQPLYGEYNDLQLGINLDPLDDAYLVRITDESGKAVYEKNVNTGNIVGLNIDISNYAEGRYTVTVENSLESFTGEFEAEPTGIKEVRSKKAEVRDYIYNLQGQRISSLQKGLNIVNGQKVFVK